MGTPRCMSPEQARGEKADARTDIFSLGVVAYEMIAGRAPFTGATRNDVIASILKDEPPPLATVAPETPHELRRIICKALQRNREARYQNVPDLISDLKQLQRDLEFASEEKKRSGRAKAEGEEDLVIPFSGEISRPRTIAPQGETTNKTANRRRLAALGILAGLLIAATVAWFYFNRAPVLTSKDTILLADFDNRTGDNIFDGTLKQGLAIQLQQSPFLNLFPEARVRQTLRLMGRSAEERVTAETARAICERHDLKALIAGSIAPLGSHYVITLEAINGQTGEVLAREQTEAESREQVLRALSRVTTQLREKLGESLSSIQRFDKPLEGPLEQATTSKLEAFKAWSVAIELSYRGRPMEAIPFYKRAVELDSNFAHAYAVLSAVYSGSGRPGLAAEYAEKGYALRDRVSEFEKLRITNFYHGFATGDLNKRIEVLMLLKRIYPREMATPSDLALTYIQTGQFDQAVAQARESIGINPDFAPAHRALAGALLRLNRLAEAKDALTQALQQKFDNPGFHSYLYEIAFINGDASGMQQQLDWASGKPYEYMAFDWQAGAAAFAGQCRRAQEQTRRAIDLAARGDTNEVAAGYASEQALRLAVLSSNFSLPSSENRKLKLEIQAQVQSALSLARGRASLPRVALALGMCSQTDQAKPLVDELTKRYPEDTIINSIWLPVIRAAIELQRGNAAGTIEQLQTTVRYEAAAEFWPQYLRGLAYLKLKQGTEGATEFQKILDHRGQAPLSVLYPLAQLGSARAAALAGDLAKRRTVYEDFFRMWKSADTDLPILIDAKREYEKK
jgi:tetratricopeptide (TPR) repeat protein